MQTPNETDIETVARRHNLSPQTVADLVQSFRGLGYRVEKRTHRDVQLPKLPAFPSVLEGDR